MFDDNNINPWRFAAGSVFTGAAGYALLKNRKLFQEAWNMGNVDIIGQTASQARGLTGFHSVRNAMPGSDVIDEALQASIAGLGSKVGLKESIANIHAATYRSIMAGGQTTHKEALGALGDLYKQTSSLGAYRSGLASVQKYQGDVASFTRSIRDLSSMPVGGFGTTSPGGFGMMSTPYISKSLLSNQAQSKAKEVAMRFPSDIKWGYKNINDVVGSKAVTTPMMFGELEGVKFGIPLANTGITYGGPSGTSRYLTRKGYTASGEILNFSDFYEQGLTEAIQRSKNNAELKSNLLNAHQKVIEQMNIRDSASRSAAIWTGPYMTSGGLAKARLISQEAVALGTMAEDDILSLLGRGLYPYTSPSAAGAGTLTTRNLAEDLFGPMGKFMSASDRPTQFIRSEWGVTGAAKAQATPFGGTFGKAYNRLDRKIQGNMYKRLLYGSETAASAKAYTAPQLMTFYAKPASQGFGLGYEAPALNQMLTAEEGLISNKAVNMMEYQRITQKKIALDKGFMVNKKISSALTGAQLGETASINIGAGGRFVGIEKGTGKEILTGIDDSVTSVIGAQLSGENEATVFMKEKRKLSNKEMWKFFSEENKFMAAAASEEKMRSALGAAGLGETVNIAGQPIEAMFSGKLVGRNKMALLTQQIEATSMFLGQKIDVGAMQMTPEVASFLDDPAAFLRVKELLNAGSSKADIEIQRNLIGLAKSAGFSNKEMGLTFGLMGQGAISEFAQGGILSAEQAAAISASPGVVGLFKGRLGDLATGGGAGKIASFEQTGFRALAMKGSLGQAYAGELSSRLLGKGELSAADKMAATILNQESFLQKASRGDLVPFGAGSIVQEQGRYVDIGRKVKAFGGSNVMYIPGTVEAPGLMASAIKEGEAELTPIARELEYFSSSLRKLKDGRIAEEEFETVAVSLRNTIMQHTEAQAAGRGKVLGSRFLTGQRKSFAKNADVFRISEATGIEMFEELSSRAKTQEQIAYIAKQRAKFSAGEVMMGGMWRHPTTGPESFQFVQFMKDKDIVNGMVAAPTQFGKIQFQDGRVMPVDVSAMVGFKGDFDRDQFALSVISEKHIADKARRAVATQAREEYAKYAFNHYAMKDLMEETKVGSSILDWSSHEGLSEGYRKLSTAKTATGNVNVALQKLKLGVAYAAPEQYRPMAEMFYHLEEAAIGGKHGVVGADIYKAIGESVETGGTVGTRQLQGVIESIMGKEARTITGSITDEAGRITQHQLQYNPKQWAETAMSAYGAVDQEVNAAMRSAAVAKGKQLEGLTLEKAVEMFHARKTSVDVSQNLFQQGAGPFDRFTTKAARAVRSGKIKSGSIFKAFTKAKKPILAGAALAAGIMLAAPSTAGELRNPEGANAGRNMDPDYGMPPGGDGMYIPPARMNVSPKVYDIGGGRSVSHANIRMRTNDLDSSSGDFMRSARQLSNGGNVNIRTRDDRSALDTRMLANKIHERL